MRHFTLILNIDFSERMTTCLFDRYLWLGIILAKFNLQYSLCSPFPWKMVSSQYVGLGYKARLTKVSQSFFIIFSPWLTARLVLHLLISAISLPSQDFIPVRLGLNPTLLKNFIIFSVCTDESENRLCSTAITKPRIFSSLCMVGQQQSIWSTACASQLRKKEKKKESTSEEDILANLIRKSQSLYCINNNCITKLIILNTSYLKFPG